VWSVGCRGYSGFRVQVSDFRSQVSGFRVPGFGRCIEVENTPRMVQCFVSRVWYLGSWAGVDSILQGLGVSLQGVGVRVERAPSCGVIDRESAPVLRSRSMCAEEPNDQSILFETHDTEVASKHVLCGFHSNKL
jgi:hypothetical protein